MRGAVIAPEPVSVEKIQSRAKFDEERRARVLNPKNPGVDYAALQTQIAEKQAAAQAAAEEEERMAATLRDYDRLTVMNDRQQAAMRTARLQDVISYRQEHQRPELADSYELNSKAKIDEAPSEDFGVSSLRAFDGEDLEFAARKKAQQQQTQQWTAEAEAAAAAAAAAIEEERRLEFANLTATVAAVEREQARGASLRAAAVENAKETNIEMAAKRREAERQERLRQAEQAEADKLAQLSGPLLDENPARALHNGKILPDRYKGFSQEQLDEIYATQKLQAGELAARKEAEEEQKRKFMELQTYQAAQLHLADRAAARLRKERAAQQAAANLAAAEDRRGNKGVPQGVVTQNEISDSFFSQFGKSHR